MDCFKARGIMANDDGLISLLCPNGEIFENENFEKFPNFK